MSYTPKTKTNYFKVCTIDPLPYYIKDRFKVFKVIIKEGIYCYLFPQTLSLNKKKLVEDYLRMNGITNFIVIMVNYKIDPVIFTTRQSNILKTFVPETKSSDN